MPKSHTWSHSYSLDLQREELRNKAVCKLEFVSKELDDLRDGVAATQAETASFAAIAVLEQLEAHMQHPYPDAGQVCAVPDSGGQCGAAVAPGRHAKRRDILLAVCML